jgi:polyisoprenoid-binding protein YceI
MALFSRKSSGSTATVEEFDGGTAAIDDLTGDYTIDPAHSRIGFQARHAMGTSVRGSFGEFDGTVHLDPTNVDNSWAKITIKPASVTTGQEQRDGHLTTGDFFDIENHPEITFQSTSSEKVDDETYNVTGDLTIKGVTKPVTIEWTFNGSAKDPYGNLRAGFEGKATINRSDWGMNFNAALETGGVLVSEKIKLEFDVSLLKTAVGASA